MLEQLRHFPRILVNNRLLHGSPECSLLQRVGRGPHGADALVDVDVGGTGHLHGLAQLGLDVPDALGTVQADLQDPVISSGLGSKEADVSNIAVYLGLESNQHIRQLLDT